VAVSRRERDTDTPADTAAELTDGYHLVVEALQLNDAGHAAVAAVFLLADATTNCFPMV
jgi:hypothetical protein